MSVQLILYPQGHNGVYNQYSNPSFNFVVNGHHFTGLNNTPTASGSVIPFFIHLNPPVIPNSWYRFAYFGSNFPYVYPTQVNNNLLITTDGSGTVGGVYQRITGLTQGVQYQAVINIIPPSQPSYNGTIRVFTQRYGFQPAYTSNYAIDENTTQVIHQVHPLTQVGTVDTVLFVGYIASTDNCTIGSIKMIPTSGSSGSILLDDGQVICDLYEDEELPLTLSVDEFKNVAEKPQSYSKAFNLPATKRNNRIFDHIFEITRHLDGGSPLFNPYQKTQCVLKQDGLLIFQGYLRMLDIVDKGGEISYNVNLYSEVVALADLLKDKKFSDLDFSELEHDYDRNNIKNSNNNGVSSGQTTPITYLNPSTSGFRTNFNTVKYPFIDWTGQLVIANGLTNATSGFPELASLEQAFRPCINIKYLIDRIFEQSDVPFTYTSTFFNTTEFSELFMDFNWGEGNAPFSFNTTLERANAQQSITPTGTNITLLFNDIINTPSYLEAFGYDDTTGVFTAVNDNQIYNIDLNLLMTRIAGAASVTVEIIKNGVVHSSISNYAISSGSGNYLTFNNTLILQSGDTWYVRARKISGGQIRFSDSLGVASLIVNTQGIEITNNDLLQTLRGELGQWEFLKGLLTMFNLVTVPDKDNPDNIIIETYVDTFINNTSKELNWTDKIDISEMKLEPLTDLNRNTLFKYVEDEDDYAFQNFKEATSGFLYGSLEYDSTNEFNILEGTEEIEASPFAATVIKSLEPVSLVNFVTPAMYSMNGDGTSEPFDNSPRIFYNRGLFGGVSYYIPAQNNQTEDQAVEYGYFSHLRLSSTSAGKRDLNFGIQQLFPNVFGGTINNLYNLYWADYFNELYNINTRVMTIKVNLNSSDLNTFQFNQRVFIKNRLFRVNKIDYKPNDLSTVEFILVQHSSGRGGGGD